MGQPQAKKKGLTKKIKKYKRATMVACGKGGNRVLDLDQIQRNVVKAEETGTDLTSIPYNDELPGGGQFYCFETDIHFIDAKSLADHKKTREYKRRVKQLKEEPYDPDFAAGLTKEKLPPAHHGNQASKTK
jgi:bud site selection protein 20